MTGAQTLAIGNRKGGTGKTTTAINLGAALAEAGQRVLLVDLDSSGNLTAHCGIDLNDGDITAYEVIAEDEDAASAICQIQGERTGIMYDVLPADDAMQTLTLNGQPQTRLRTALEPLKNDYDYIILDTGPAIDASTIQSMIAADSLLITARPSVSSLSAIAAITEIMSDLTSINPNLDIAGVLMTQYDPRKKHHREVLQTLEKAMPGKVLDIQISTGVAVEESESYGLDLYEYVAQTPARKKTRAAEQYRELAKRVLTNVTN